MPAGPFGLLGNPRPLKSPGLPWELQKSSRVSARILRVRPNSYTRKVAGSRPLRLLLPGRDRDDGLARAPAGPTGNRPVPHPRRVVASVAPLTDRQQSQSGKGAQPCASRTNGTRRGGAVAVVERREEPPCREGAREGVGGTKWRRRPGPGAQRSTAPAVAGHAGLRRAQPPRHRGADRGPAVLRGAHHFGEHLLPDDKLRFIPSMSSGLDTDTKPTSRVVNELIQAAVYSACRR